MQTITTYCDAEHCGNIITTRCYFLSRDAEGPWHFCGPNCLRRWIAHNDPRYDPSKS